MKELERPESLQWFVDRIGKLVFRNQLGCGCNSCEEAEIHGLIINTYQHAKFLYDNQYKIETRYSDNKQ